jgi:hypothetical protein
VSLSTLPASSYVDEGRGSLTGIDPSASKEIGKIWSNWEARTSGEDYGFMTRAQVNSAIASVSQRIDALPTQTPQVPQTGGSSAVVGGGAASGNLLVSNNTWTGTNVWNGAETPGVLRNRFLGLQSGTITQFTPANDTVNLEGASYQALVDVQKTFDANAFSGPIGGNSALMVQSRTGNHTGGLFQCFGIRCHAESYAVGDGTAANHVAAGYFIGHNAAIGSLGHGLRVEMWHAALFAGGLANSFGVEASMLRASGAGVTVAFHARAGAARNYNLQHDYAFLGSGVGAQFKTIFAAGSPQFGSVTCDFGLDLSRASCNIAAVSIPGGKSLMFDGPLNSAGFSHGSGLLTYAVAGIPKVTLSDDGTVTANLLQGGTMNCGNFSATYANVNAILVNGSLRIGAPVLAATAGASIGYLDMGGCKVAAFAP